MPIDPSVHINLQHASGKYKLVPSVNLSGAHVGYLFMHETPEGLECSATIRIAGEGPNWAVLQQDPLTLNPSVVCQCGVHGFIENGKWRAV